MRKSHRKSKFNLLNFRGGSCSTNTLDVSKYTNPNGVMPSQDGYQNIFERVFLNPGPSQSGVTVPDCNLTPQTGSGYTFDFTDPISKQPTVQSYPDCCPPVIQNGQLILSNGTEPQCGAGRKRSLRKSKNHMQKPSQKKSKPKHNGGSYRKSNSNKGYSGGNKNTKKKTNTRRSGQKKSHRKHKQHNKPQSHTQHTYTQQPQLQMGGGDGQTQDSIFTSDMTSRDFGCTQPNWNPTCI